MAPRTGRDRQPARQETASPARALARDLLHDTVDRGRPLPEGSLGNLAPADEAFARRLARTAIRRVGDIDQLVAQLMERPLPESSSRTRNALRIGVCELEFMETADHAATDEAVRLADPRHTGLVNAVLRNLVRRRDSLDRQAAPGANLPDWLYRSWVKAHGADRAAAIADALRAEPPLDLTCPKDAAAWAERTGGALLPPSTIRLAGGAVTTLPGYADGAWWVQDRAASLPATLLGDVAGLEVADLCAAPGGKTAQLAATGARVTALDRSAKRLERLSGNLARLGLAAETVVADAASWEPGRKFDAVLLDAPCSATGTLRRHPDVAWTKRPADVASLAEVQRRILAAAANLVAERGRLVYCVCSLQPEEGPAVIEDFLKARPDWRLDPVTTSELPDLDTTIRPDGTVLTAPDVAASDGSLDGFYMARLNRKTA
ncbi:MAG: transcription antitermination factor NusB [Rhodospirillales bacterium]